MGDDRNIRHRFTVPKDDDLVEEWIGAQSNLGFSLRVLIRAFVRSYGTKDATCMELGTAVRRVGRPPKQAQIALEGMMDADPGVWDGTAAGGLEVSEEDEEQAVRAAPAKEKEAAKAPVQAQPHAGQGDIMSMFGAPAKTSKAGDDLMANMMNME